MMNTKRVRIVVDTDPMDPREWDNAGRMICWHRRYNLGDDHKYDCEDFFRQLAFEACDGLEERINRLEDEGWTRRYDKAVDDGKENPVEYVDSVVDARVNELIESAVRDGYLILPLFLMDHSGITISTGSFSCPWDSGQVGYIICDNETIEREWGGDRDLAEKCLEAEVSVYDDYLTGNVYGFIVEDEDGEEIDSCFGFFGYDVYTNGMADHLGDELTKLAADADIEYQ